MRVVAEPVTVGNHAPVRATVTVTRLSPSGVPVRSLQLLAEEAEAEVQGIIDVIAAQCGRIGTSVAPQGLFGDGLQITSTVEIEVKPSMAALLDPTRVKVKS